MRIVAPILNPEKVLCVGMNYRDHCEEHNTPVPEEPVVFNKFPSCIIGPTDDLEYPTETEVRVQVEFRKKSIIHCITFRRSYSISITQNSFHRQKLDWEVELAFVIGKEANRIKVFSNWCGLCCDKELHVLCTVCMYFETCIFVKMIYAGR